MYLLMKQKLRLVSKLSTVEKVKVDYLQNIVKKWMQKNLYS